MLSCMQFVSGLLKVSESWGTKQLLSDLQAVCEVPFS